jgi:predicted amidohydrolase
MRISLLQPEIIRGNIEHNLKVVQRLVDKSKGELLVLPEYALTGSLVLDLKADVREWARAGAQAETQLCIPEGRYCLINTLHEIDGKLYNSCRLLPTEERYFKLFPDQSELDEGIQPGTDQKVFELSGKRFKVAICYDLPHMDRIPTEKLDFLLFIYHFTEGNFSRVTGEIKEMSAARRLRVLASSLVSDMNNGFSSFVEGQAVVSLSNQEGILEVDIE